MIGMARTTGGGTKKNIQPSCWRHPRLACSGELCIFLEIGADAWVHLSGARDMPDVGHPGLQQIQRVWCAVKLMSCDTGNNDEVEATQNSLVLLKLGVSNFCMAGTALVHR